MQEPTYSTVSAQAIRNILDTGPTLLGPQTAQGRIRANTVWMYPTPFYGYGPFVFTGFQRGLKVRSYFFSLRRIAKWLRDRVYYKRVQRYLVDIGINQLGESPQRGLLKYTFDQR